MTKENAQRVVDGQDGAYESAVVAARSDPQMRAVIRRSFLEENIEASWRDFVESEDWFRVTELLAHAGIGPGDRVLDLGGGRGLVAASLAAIGYNPVLCEPNPSRVCGAGAAQQFTDGLDRPFQIHNGFASEIQDKTSFDAVVCRAVLHHIHPLAPALKECLDLLRPGGVFIASDEPTIRRPEQLDQVIAEHPFVPFGVEEWAGPRSHYRRSFMEAGFAKVEDRFPVSFRGYSERVRPGLVRPLAFAGYARYRLISLARPELPEPRSFIAWAPPRSGDTT